MQCVTCYGRGCNQCDDGYVMLTSCARQQVSDEAWDMFSWVRQYLENNVLPEDGNGLAQTQSFVDALNVVSREWRQWEAKHE
jgi:hypothetical protein